MIRTLGVIAAALAGAFLGAVFLAWWCRLLASGVAFVLEVPADGMAVEVPIACACIGALAGGILGAVSMFDATEPTKEGT